MNKYIYIYSTIGFKPPGWLHPMPNCNQGFEGWNAKKKHHAIGFKPDRFLLLEVESQVEEFEGSPILNLRGGVSGFMAAIL